jgi:TP901 family phage tail tape measure protein
VASKYAIETVFKLIDKITRPLDKVGIKSKTVSRKIQKDFAAAQRRLDKIGASLAKWGKRALLAAGAAAAAFIGLGIKNAVALADTMAKIGTVADATAPPLSEIQKNLTDVANQAGFTVQELAEIAYAAIPCGIAAEASADFAAVVAKTAKITGTAADQIIGGMDTVMDAYGMAAGEAARVSGILFTASKLGGISFEEMGTGMRNVIPIAAQYGVAAEDVFASVTALATQGLTTRDAMKTLGDSISAVTHPSKDAATLARRLGLDFSEAAVRSNGWAGFLEDLR